MIFLSMITIVLVIFKYDFKYIVSINGKLDKKKCNSQNMKKSSCNSNTKNSARNSNVTEANT